jgi:hypothetical protein
LAPSPFAGRRLPESLRSRLDVAAALAWEALVDTHVAQGAAFVDLLKDRVPLEETLNRYLMEVDIADSMAVAVRTRVIAMLEGEDPIADAEPTADAEPIALVAETEEDPAVPGEGDDQGWRRFRPDVVMKGLRQRQRRDDETEGWIRLALARAEEASIATHVDNAITFAALLAGAMPLDRAVHEYIEAVTLSGGRAQAVHQRTMARLADVHLPTTPRHV